MAATVLIINYGMGNLQSVAHALESLGAGVLVSDRPRDAAACSALVLPGVGAFGDAIGRLRGAGWIEALEQEVRRHGKPFLGLCLGMQLLADRGTEHGDHRGLGWIPGTAERIPANGSGLRVPHIGWDDVAVRQSGGLYAGLAGIPAFYFLHSYVLRAEDPAVVSGVCDYGGEFAASIETGNLYATQFHPEKSQRAGLHVLRRFLDLAQIRPC